MIFIVCSSVTPWWFSWIFYLCRNMFPTSRVIFVNTLFVYNKNSFHYSIFCFASYINWLTKRMRIKPVHYRNNKLSFQILKTPNLVLSSNTFLLTISSGFLCGNNISLLLWSLSINSSSSSNAVAWKILQILVAFLISLPLGAIITVT